MSEAKKPRSFGEVQQEYVRLATQAGDLGFKSASIKKDLDLIHSQMQALGLEAVAIQKAEADAKAAEAATPAPATPTEAPTNAQS